MELKDYFKPNKSYSIDRIIKENHWLNNEQLVSQLNNLVETNYLVLTDGKYQIKQIDQVIEPQEKINDTYLNEKQELDEEDQDKTILAICEIINGQVYLKDTETIFTTTDNIMHKLVEGDIILVRIKPNNNTECNILERLGHKDDPNIDLKIIAISKSFKIEFNKDSLKQLEKIPTQVTENDIKNRLDLRDELIYTIDGADTKDMDDAISVKINERGNYVLGVHIADVAHYVPINTPLSNEAFSRGTSLYLIDKVIPMLPHQLSNGICSLNPNVDRLTISCIMEIDKKGNIIDYQITESVINSKKKMIYEDVDKILMEDELVEGYEEFIDNLKLCNELSFILSKNYNENGYLHFKDNEIKVKVDEKGKPIKFEPIVTKAGRKIIENFMLAANKTIASNYAYMPFCFRIHAEPNIEDLEQILELINKLGYNTPYNNIDRYKLNKIFKQIYEQGNYSVISPQLLKTMKKAIYSQTNIGHFGLGFENYTHFTSPIRRFNDLQVHYLIKLYNNPNINDQNISNIENLLPEICEHISQKEKLADEAEIEATKLKMAEFMKHHIGQYFNGKIIGIGPKYVSVKLENGIIGKAYLEDIKGDKFYFDKDRYAVIGLKHKTKYKLTDFIRVNVKDASLTTKSIEFSITENLEHTKTKTLTLK